MAEMLWKNIEQEPLPEWQKQLLDERLRDFEANPEDLVTWEELEAEVLADFDPFRGSRDPECRS